MFAEICLTFHSDGSGDRRPSGITDFAGVGSNNPSRLSCDIEDSVISS